MVSIITWRMYKNDQYSIMCYWRPAICDRSSYNNLCTKTQSRKVWLKVRHLVICYPNEKQLHLYKSCLLKVQDQVSVNFCENDSYQWSRFSIWHQMTRYFTSIHTVPQLLGLKLLSGDQSNILRHVSNELLNTHKITIDSQCNYGYPGSCGIFWRSIEKLHDPVYSILYL